MNVINCSIAMHGLNIWVGGILGSPLLNIARGTTDPEIDSVTCIKFSNNMAPLALVAYFTTRWRHLH